MAGRYTGKKEGNKFRPQNDSDVDTQEYDTVVLRNLDPSTEISDIKHGLEEIGYRVLSIRNAFSHLTGTRLPLFFIKLYKAPFNSTIFQLKYVAHQVVIVEEYLQGPDLPRCTRCQGLDHTKDNCNNPPVCAWCSGPHYTTVCKEVKNSVPTCSRCGGCHPSSYKGCKVYREKCLLKAQEESNKRAAIQNSLQIPISQEKMDEEKQPVPSTSRCSDDAEHLVFESGVSSSAASVQTNSETESDPADFSPLAELKVEIPPIILPPMARHNPQEEMEIINEVMEHFLSMNEDLRVKL